MNSGSRRPGRPNQRGGRQIIARMLTTCAPLRKCAAPVRLQRVLERMSVVSPSEEVRSRLDLLVSARVLAPGQYQLIDAVS